MQILRAKKNSFFANREAEKAADAQTRKNFGRETRGDRVSISGVGQLRGGLAFRTGVLPSPSSSLRRPHGERIREEDSEGEKKPREL